MLLVAACSGSPTTQDRVAPHTTTVPGSQPMPAGATPQEYADRTAIYLQDDPGLAQWAGGDVSDASCTPPTGVTVTRNYICFATLSTSESGTRVSVAFVVDIDAVDSFLVYSASRPAFEIAKRTIFTELVRALVAQGLLVEQSCVRNVVDDVSDADTDALLLGLLADERPPELDFRGDELPLMLGDCVITPPPRSTLPTPSS